MKESTRVLRSTKLELPCGGVLISGLSPGVADQCQCLANIDVPSRSNSSTMEFDDGHAVGNAARQPDPLLR